MAPTIVITDELVEWVRASRRAQGKPERVEDPVALRRIAAVMRQLDEA